MKRALEFDDATSKRKQLSGDPNVASREVGAVAGTCPAGTS